ncbi:TlpA family protein disulfide reductase [Herminiimonas arsenitoxidans]|uniref:TlpA family protein disulfide reductase n=1 Tax=Herminiimonas arsenitoxidans TaxID=1809410 RepID=UPI00097113B6|nr:TlpA disulfide reductase family protein [Herminiimonas arsenitoxidans]
MRRNVFLYGAIALFFAAVGIYFGTKHHAPAEPESPAVANFFAQQLEDSNSKIQPLSQWQGKTLIINFWATWCAPCVEEMPELTELQTELLPKNIQILGVGIDSANNIREFAAKYKITYPLYIAGINGSELSRQFGNQAGGLPFTVIIGPKGDVKKTYLGRLKMDQLRADINAL